MRLKVFNKVSARFWWLAGFLLTVFLIGGSSRADIVALLLLRPLSVMAIGYGLWALRAEDVRRYRWLLLLSACTLALPLAQLIPLPPAVWHRLPGRDLIVQIDQALGIAATWRPLTMDPPGTVNAALSLLTPLAVVIWVARLDDAEQARLLPVAIGLVLLSAALSALQTTGAVRAIYSPGSPDAGLLANRNHQAVLLGCCILMLAAFGFQWRRPSGQVRGRLILAAAASAVLVGLILVIGSRAGLVTMLLAILAAPGLYWVSVGYRIRRRDRRMLLLAIPAVLLTLLATIGGMAVMARSGSIGRLSDSTMSGELRITIWHTVMQLIETYLPLGTGLGSYVKVYQIWEPVVQLRPSYSNHAHNDWLELALTAGVPGLALLLAAVVGLTLAIVRMARTSSPQRALLGWTGVAIIVVLAIAGTVDYPLRVPSVQCLGVVALFWIIAKGGGSERPTIDRSIAGGLTDKQGVHA